MLTEFAAEFGLLIPLSVRKPGEGRTEPMDALTPTKDTPAT